MVKRNMDELNILAGKTVVIVEDEGITALQIRKVLLEQNMLVAAEAGTGELGLEYIMRFRPEIVTMDINLPGGIDGIELTRRITNEYPVCVIMLTAYSDDTYVDRAINAGALGYLLKPIRSIEFIALLQDAYKRFQDKISTFNPIAGIVEQADISEIKHKETGKIIHTIETGTLVRSTLNHWT